MKLFKIIILTLILVPKLYAQKNSLYYSFGQTFFGTWDIDGYNAVLGYEFRPKKWIGIKSQINLSTGASVKEYEKNSLITDYPFDYDTYSFKSQKIQFGISLKPLSTRRHELALDLMTLLANYSILFNNGFTYNPDPNAPVEWSYFRYPPGYEFGAGLGAMGQIGYRFKFEKGLGVGLDYNMQIYKGGHGERNINLVLQHTF